MVWLYLGSGCLCLLVFLRVFFGIARLEPLDNQLMARTEKPEAFSGLSFAWLCLGAFFLTPIRLVLFILLHCLMFGVVLSVAPWPTAFSKPISLFWLQKASGLALLVMGCVFEEHFSSDFLEEGTLVSNHASLFDGYYFTSRFLPVIVAKQELKGAPLLGAILKHMGTIFVDRKATNEVMDEQKSKISEYQRQSQEGSPPLLIFPEGTTTNNTSLMSFKKGGFAAMTPVRPVVLQYDVRPNRISTCYCSLSGWQILILACAQLRHPVKVHYLPQMTARESENVSEYAHRVWNTMNAQICRV